MPSKGDSFTITLKSNHLKWGTETRKGLRNRSVYEVYLPIPLGTAKKLGIMAAAVNENDSIYKAKSADGNYNYPLKASGSAGEDLLYAKNFQSSGNLKMLGYWLKDKCHAKAYDQVKIEWIEEDEILLTFIAR